MTRANDLATLGVDLGATAADIRAAYRSKALHHHPDLGGDADEMAQISNAYQRLLEPDPLQSPAPGVDQVSIDPDDAPDDFTIGHSMLAFVVVPVILAIILMLGVFSVLSTIL